MFGDGLAGTMPLSAPNRCHTAPAANAEANVIGSDSDVIRVISRGRKTGITIITKGG